MSAGETPSMVPWPILLNFVGFMCPCFAGTETATPKHQTSLEKIEQKIERKKDEAVFLAREFTKSRRRRSGLGRASYPSGQGLSRTARLRPMAVPVPRG